MSLVTHPGAGEQEEVTATLDVLEAEPEMLAKVRSLGPLSLKLLSVIGIAMSLFHVYTAVFGVFDAIAQRGIHLGLALLLTFLFLKTHRNGTDTVPWYDWLLMLLVVVSYGYFVWNAEEISSRIAYVTDLTATEMFMGVTGILVLLEATRRAVGNSMVLIALASLVYGLYGHLLPAEWGGHRRFDLQWVVDHMMFTTSGVFGVTLGVSATYIFLFILFGKFLEVVGAGQFFVDLAVAAMGKYRGGPAKTAVLGSSVLGMISGSAVANTVTVGSFTIPLMKKTGYTPVFAAAVEAVASSGGQIMPPIMGASAFIIASYLGVPYFDIAVAAVIPAVLYYVCLYFQIDFRAQKLGLKGIDTSHLKVTAILKQGYLYVTPLVLIVALLAIGYSPMFAGIVAIGSVLLIGVIKRATSRLSLKTLLQALDLGARSAIETAIACGVSGIIVGVFTLTGIGLKFSSLLLSFTGGSLFVTLVVTMVTSLLLGLGLPTVAAYVIQVALNVPALTELGVPPLAAHMFIFYFAAVSAITPPVALAAFAAAGIAKADPDKTGWQACVLGIAAYLVPFLFVYAPELLLMGSAGKIAVTCFFAVVGVWAMAAAAEGWLIRRTTLPERLILLASSFALMIPELISSVAGLLSVAFVYLMQKRSARNVKAAGNTRA